MVLHNPLRIGGGIGFSAGISTVFARIVTGRVVNIRRNGAVSLLQRGDVVHHFVRIASFHGSHNGRLHGSRRHFAERNPFFEVVQCLVTRPIETEARNVVGSKLLHSIRAVVLVTVG